MVISPAKPVLRVMVDTTILLSGIMWPRWPHEVLQAALNGTFQLVLSPYITKEAKRKFREKFSDFADDFEEFLTECPYTEVPNPSQRQLAEHHHLSRDIEDVPIVLAGRMAKVDCVVSEDKDITSLTLQDVRIVLSGTFLREYMGWTSKQLEAIRHRKWKDVIRK